MVAESYVSRTHSRFQHTLSGQMVAVHKVEPAGKPSCVGRRGAHVYDVHRCGVLSGSCPSSLGLDDGVWKEFVVPLDTTTKNISYSSHKSAGA